MTKKSSSTKSPRLASLDALRGFDMFGIMSGEQIVHALAKATGWGHRAHASQEVLFDLAGISGQWDVAL